MKLFPMASDGWPKLREQLTAEGYRLGNHGHCKGCSAVILWVHTPNDKAMPLSPTFSEGARQVVSYQPHWADCPARDQFKGKSKVLKPL